MCLAVIGKHGRVEVVDETGCVLLVKQRDFRRVTELIVPKEIKDSELNVAYSVAFSLDGKYLLSGGGNGIRQWQVNDGREVWRSFEGRDVYVIALSRDHKWIVSGAEEGATVWDAESHEKVHQVGPSDFVLALDISPDSTKFVTGAASRGRTGSPLVNVWDITTGEKLIAILEHDGSVVGVKFSPNGNHIATFTDNHHIRVFDSRFGDQLIVFDNQMPSWSALTPIVWPADGQVIAISEDGQIKSFNTSTGSQLAEWQIPRHDSGDFMSIALSANNRFIASSAGHSVSFWDTSTHTQLGGVLKDVGDIRSVALSPDGTHLATGEFNGTITICNLRSILPESYLPITVSTTFMMSGRPITSVYNLRFTMCVNPFPPRIQNVSTHVLGCGFPENLTLEPRQMTTTLSSRYNGHVSSLKTLS